jgi:hypothetical protein
MSAFLCLQPPLGAAILVSGEDLRYHISHACNTGVRNGTYSGHGQRAGHCAWAGVSLQVLRYSTECLLDISPSFLSFAGSAYGTTVVCHVST